MSKLQKNKSNGRQKISRRTFLCTSAAATMVSVISPGFAENNIEPEMLSMNLHSLSDKQAVEVYIKMLGSLEPSVIYTWFSGHLWGILPGRPATQLVSFEGIAKNVWRRDGDEITKQSYDIGYFGDAETGEVINSFENPFTGKTVAPYHYAYGGRITRYAKSGIISDEKIESLKQKWQVSGDQAWFEETNSASVQNPFDPKEWPLASAGKEMHFASSTTNTAKLSDLLEAKSKCIPYTLFWTAINSWEPWLQMADTPGYVMWRATGRKLADLSEAPDSIIDYARKVQQNYFSDEQPWKGVRSTWADYRRDRKSSTNSK